MTRLAIALSPPTPSITITHLSADASFLLSYLPVRPSPATSTTLLPSDYTPFTVLLDPWLVGTSPVFHPSFSVQSHTVRPSITHLSQLPSPPDVVLISQDKSDHCHEETLRQLDTKEGGRDSGVRIFAVKGAYGKVKGWGIVTEDKVGELKPWRAGRKGGVGNVIVRIDIPIPGSDSETSTSSSPQISAHLEIAHLPAVYPWEFPSLHSALAIRFVTTYTYPIDPTLSNQPQPQPHTHLTLFTPHGVAPSALLPYLNSLSSPFPSSSLTPKVNLLLHPFTLTLTPPHLGGKITLGTPNISALVKAGIRTEVVASAHDEAKAVGGYVSSRIKCTRWSREDVFSEILKVVADDGGGEGQEEVPEVWDLGNGEVRECVLVRE